MFKYRSEKRDKYYGLVTDMYFKEGVSITTISKKISTPRATIRRWLRNIADENHIEMASKKYCKKTDCKPVKASNEGGTGSDEKALLNEIKRLERELKRERLRADLNEEIINVAEQKFNIQIRKKAGTKQ